MIRNSKFNLRVDYQRCENETVHSTVFSLADRDGVATAGGRPGISRLERRRRRSGPHQIFLIEQL
ncbi:jg23006, partial [Pararge aegeria aegeria]